MILAVAAVTYLYCMQGFPPAGSSPRLRPHVEDQHLQDAPIISIIDDDESMRCAMKSFVTSVGFPAYTFASAEEFLQSRHLGDTSCLITDLQRPERRRTAEIAVGAGSPYPHNLRDRF